MSSENWRPENWKNPHQEDGWDCGNPDMGKLAHRTFEDGADAMLEALKARANEGIVLLGLKGETDKGLVVFIPDK